jgi:hypothetical protein
MDKLADIDKARKLLAKAKSTDNEHERDTARSLAANLLRRHNLAPEDIETPDYIAKSTRQAFAPRTDVFARMAKASNWKHRDPRTEGYKTKKEDE